MNTATIVQKLWNYCNVLRDDGMPYGDYVEQFAACADLAGATLMHKDPEFVALDIPQLPLTCKAG